MIHRAYIMADHELDVANAIRPSRHMVTSVPSDCITFPLGRKLAEAEQRLIYATLGYCGGNKTMTAEVLGISLKTLYNRLNEYQAKVFSGELAPQPRVYGPEIDS